MPHNTVNEWRKNKTTHNRVYALGFKVIANYCIYNTSRTLLFGLMLADLFFYFFSFFCISFNSALASSNLPPTSRFNCRFGLSDSWAILVWTLALRELLLEGDDCIRSYHRFVLILIWNHDYFFCCYSNQLSGGHFHFYGNLIGAVA